MGRLVYVQREEEGAVELHQQLEEFERLFQLAEPRLAAFKRLEELAREQMTSPEALATQAALEVLRREQDELTLAVDHAASERNNLRGEISMLVGNKQDSLQVLDDLQVECNDLHSEVNEILDDLQMLRNDAVRLMSERRLLEVQVASLRAEVSSLEDQKVEAKTTSPALAASVVCKTPQFDVDETDHEERRRFDRFFQANLEHDKARDWILR